MGAHLQLFRRGNVFYWRRRIPGFSTENAMIQLSLRTGMRREAYILARKLTAESDRMYDDMSRNLVSIPDARAFLSHVINDELARMRRVDLVTRMDALGTSESDRRADWATAQAWKLMAEHGPRAEIDETARARLQDERASDKDMASLEISLDLYARDMLSEARMNRIGAEFRQITDQQNSLGAVQLLYLRRLLIEGKAAAQAQRGSAAFGMEGEMAHGLAEQLASDLAMDTRAAWAGTAVVVPPVSTIPEASLSRELSVTQEYVPVPTIPIAPQDDIYDPSLLATVERLNEAKMLQQRQETGKDHVPETMAKLRRVTAKLFILITGVKDLRQVRQAHVSMFRDALHHLPKSWGKGPHDGVMTWASVMAHAKTLPPAQVGLAISTINRHLDVFGQILARAEEDGIPLDPKVNPKKFRLREKKRSRDKRTGFPETSLNRLFQHTIWTGCKSGRLRNTSGKRIIKDGLYCPHEHVLAQHQLLQVQHPAWQHVGASAFS